MNSIYDVVIGIDPDVERSGVALLVPRHKELEVKTLSFPLLLDYLQDVIKCAKESSERLVVVVEAGWLSQAHWHVKRGDNLRVASAKGNSTGRNHETGRKIVEMCKHYGVEVVEHFPLKKCWKGPDGKITSEELAKVTGRQLRCNQDARDAALLAWYFALPMMC